MISILNNVKEQYLLACSCGLDLLFVWILILYLFGGKKQTGVLRNLLVYLFAVLTSAFIIVVVCSLKNTDGGNGRLYEYFFMLPVVMVLIILFTLVYLRLEKRESKLILIVGLAAIMFSNTAVQLDFSKIDVKLNKLGVDEDAVQICDKLNNLGVSTVLSVQSYEEAASQCESITRFLAEPVNVIDANGGAVTAEQVDVVNMVDLAEQYRTDGDDATSPAEPYRSVAESYGIEYIVLDDNYNDADYMVDMGYSEVMDVGKYHVYYMPNQKWTVTKYASESGNQSMIYTLDDLNNNLIIIDGGWTVDADQLLPIIESHGNHVAAWIITHPDADHVGAFNQIFSDETNCENITIDTLYCPDIDHDEYQANAQPWDGFADYETFLSVTEGWDNIIEVKAGDHYQIADLNVDFYNSYSNKIEGTDAVNDGSLLFKISGRRNSMLFCADVGWRMSETLIEQWGDNLKADYLQMGHHGNGGLNEDFYRLVQPSVAFADAPEWLFHPEDGTATYDSEIKTAIMEDVGAVVYYYATAPNRVEIR